MADSSIMASIVMEFKKDMHTLMDGRDKKDMLNHIKQKLPGLNDVDVGPLKEFEGKVKLLPFSSKEKYKILYCAMHEKRMKGISLDNTTANNYLKGIQDWKEANGYKHLDCSHLHKTGDDDATKATREIIYILHNISLE
tara:strand:- start:436 stop:852 length:417 start_codon:yes stop_codon:yes gene_type:complete